jgi:Holliday junction resolvase-like predicted endonuclease
MTTTSIGRAAEQAAGEELTRRGYEIAAFNWRTRTCEIDIVAKRDNCVHFVEVKYRHADLQGPGLDYVTKSKLRQMTFAAEEWAHENRWNGDMNLAAIEVCAPDFAIGEFIESIV